MDDHWRFIWPLYPVLNRQVITRDLESGREVSDGDPTWAYMILSVVSCTIMWLPIPFLPMPAAEARRLVDVIGDLVKHFLAQPYEYETAGLARCESISVIIVHATHLLTGTSPVAVLVSG